MPGEFMELKEKYITLDVNQASVRSRSPELSLLFEINDLLSTPLELRQVLHESLSTVMTFFQMDSGRIYSLDGDGMRLDLVAYHGIDPEGLETVSIQTGFSGKAVRTQSFIAQHVSDLEDRERVDLLKKRGLEVVMCVPLITRDRVLGVMNLSAKRDMVLDHGRIDLLITIGNQIAVAVDDARLYKDLEDKVEALEEKEKMITFFAYSISHDLKSPAASLYALATRLKEKYSAGLEDKGMEHCDLIVRTARQMLTLVEMINAYIAARESPLHLEEIPVGEVVKGIVEEFSGQIHDRHVRVTGVEGLPSVVADRMGLTRVFRNLLDNALKYGGEALSEIRVGYHREDRFHVFSFADDGEGITEQDRERLFELFARRKHSKGVSGTGMGLAIVKAMLERHGGQIWVDPAYENGAKFYLSISDELKPDPVSERD
jgi:K+-sensing histidine kinase KdpD